MLKFLLAGLLAAVLLKPVEDMTLEELQARLTEIAMEIASQGGAITPEQEAEMAAIEARLEAIINGEVEARADEMAAAEAEAQAMDDLYTMPDTMPLDRIGRAFAEGLPKSFRGQACNTGEAPDTYQNLAAFYAGKGIEPEPTGQLFFRECGGDEPNYRFAIDTTMDASSFVSFIERMHEGPADPGVTTFTVCGQKAVSSDGFLSTVVSLAGHGTLTATDWEGEGQSVATRLATQRAMLEAVNCQPILRELGR